MATLPIWSAETRPRSSRSGKLAPGAAGKPVPNRRDRGTSRPRSAFESRGGRTPEPHSSSREPSTPSRYGCRPTRRGSASSSPPQVAPPSGRNGSAGSAARPFPRIRRRPCPRFRLRIFRSAEARCVPIGVKFSRNSTAFTSLFRSRPHGGAETARPEIRRSFAKSARMAISTSEKKDSGSGPGVTRPVRVRAASLLAITAESRLSSTVMQRQNSMLP